MNRMTRIRIYDISVFLKENFLDILKTEKDNPNKIGIRDFIYCWNSIVKEISKYGYHEKKYYTPSTLISIKAIRIMFNLKKSDNEFWLPDNLLGGIWYYCFMEDYNKIPLSKISRKIENY